MASAVIGSLRVNLGADSAAFSKGLKDAEGGMNRFARAAKMGLAAVGAAVATAAAGLAVALRGAINNADEMGKAAQAVGVPVEELTRLRHAAEMSGSSLEGLKTGLRTLGQRMDESLRKPTSEAAQTFQRLGIELKNADGTMRATADVVGDVAERFANMDDGAQKTALAVQMFGRAGADLIPMLNGGRDALQAMKDEADALGLTISGNTAAAAARFNDSVSRLWKVLEGMVNTLAAELAPVLDLVAGKFEGAARSSMGFGDTIRSVVENSMRVWGFFMDSMRGWELIIAHLKVAWAGFGNFLIQSATKMADAIQTLVDTMIGGINSVIEGLNAMGASLGAVQTMTERGAFTQLRENADEAALALARANLAFGLLRRQPLPSHDVEAFIEATRNIEPAASGARAAFEAAADGIEGAATRIGGGARGAAGAVRELADESKQLKDVGADLSQSLGQEFSSMFTGLIDGTKSAGEAIKGLLQNLGKLLINKAFSALFGGMGGGGGFLSGLFGGFRASGGPVSGGKAYVVGERGPELMVPNMSGTVIPNHALNDNDSGGGHVSVSLTLSDDLDARIESTSGRVSAQIVQANNRQIPAILSNSQRRSG
jgi:hypothetical protein